MDLPKAQSALTPKSDLPWSFRDAIIRLIIFYSLILVFLLTFQLGFTGLFHISNPWFIEALIVGVVGLVLSFIFLSFDGKKVSSVGFLIHKKTGQLVIISLITTTISLTSAYIIEMSGGVVSLNQMLTQRYFVEDLSTPDQLFNYVLIVIITFCCIAVGEELMFRGYIQNILESQFSFLKATLISSILFGFVHSFLSLSGYQNVLNTMIALGVSATIFGFVFAYAYRITGNNLTLAILIHGIWDSIIYFFNTQYNYATISNVLTEISSQIVAALILIGLLYFLKKNLHAFTN